MELPGVEVKYLNLNLSRWFFLKKEFIAVLKELKPDLVHINGIWNPQIFLFQQAARSLGIKVLISPHGMLEPYILNRHPLKKKLALFLYQKKAIKLANYIHATAQSELEQIRKLGFVSPATVIPNGIDLSEIIKQEKLISDSSFKNILFLSRIHPKKGIELLIEAIQQLKNEKIKVIIAGEGDSDYIKSLIELTVKRKVEKNIKFIGGVYGQDKWDLYQQADIFVLPTYSENFGIVVIEALAAGVPVITTTGTPWQELQTYNCGWWIDLNISNLKKTIQDAIGMTPYELNKMGENGKKLVKSKYDIKAVSKETFKFYKTILQE
jgi:glycosyltransferase involved in cell wall biosynthesis